MADRLETLIIGAGPAGLTAAHELAAAGRDFVVVEKDKQVGGLAKTYVVREGELEFRTDNGPHRFYSKDKKLYEFIGKQLGERWIPVKRLTRQYVDGKFYDYPINAAQAMKNLGPVMVLRCGFGYVAAAVKYGLLKAPIRNFRDYAYANFGKPLAEFNIINYTEKIWGVPCDRLHLDWAGQRIAGLNVLSLLANVLKKVFARKGGETPKSLVDLFWYPETGAGLIYETIAADLAKRGKEIRLNTRPTKIFHDGRHITKVRLESGNESWEMPCGRLIESVHVTQFLKLLDPAPPAPVMEAAAKLKYRSQVHLFLTLDKPSVTADNWVYFPGREIPFARASEMRNFSPKMSPPGKTSLFIEFFCDETDPVAAMSAEQLADLAVPHFEKFGFFKRSDVRHAYKFAGGQDYPIYTMDYKDNLKVVKDYLDGFENLWYIGRPGRFRYNNQDHSMLMGLAAARDVIAGTRLDLEKIGNEDEYFEKGEVEVRAKGHG